MEEAVFYDEFHKKSNIQEAVVNRRNFTYRYVISIIENQIFRMFKGYKKGIEMLDFGCGAGTLSFYFAARGIKVTGIDISKRVIVLANKSIKELGLEKNAGFYKLNEGKKEIKSKKYDIVLCLEVIEHVEKDEELIRFLATKLKKDGILIISTPLISAPLNRLGLTRSFDKEVGHLRRYSKSELIDYIGGMSGVEIVESKITEGILRNSLYIFPTLGIFVRFIRGPISDLVTYIDILLIKLFGGSNVFIIVKKK